MSIFVFSLIKGEQSINIRYMFLVAIDSIWSSGHIEYTIMDIPNFLKKLSSYLHFSHWQCLIDPSKKIDTHDI